MMLHSILFYTFATIMFGAALGVVFSRNPVHAVMFLVLTFFNAAMLWLLAEAEFLAIVLVLVYVGAVMVLFLFVVMMLDIDVEAAKRGLDPLCAVGHWVALLMAVELVNVIWLRKAIKGGSLVVLLPRRRVTTTPRRWARSCTPSMFTLLRSPRSYCCWQSLRRLR